MGPESWPSKAEIIEGKTLPAGAGLVTMEFSSLTSGDVAPHYVRPFVEGTPFGDVAIETKEDDRGSYSLISFAPAEGSGKWFPTRVEIPQVAFPNGAEWVELEVWNDGTPVHIVADGVEKNVPCFEVTFVENDEAWSGWQIRRMHLRTGRFSMWDEDTVREIHNPFKFKYLLVIMRQGLPWKIGLRRMTFRVDPES